MNDVLTKTVGQLVVDKPSRSRVFERFGIDYCCGGKKTLGDACMDANASEASVVKALAEADRDEASIPSHDWANSTMNELIDHILSAHHAYLRRELPRLSEMAAKVVSAHGERHAWVAQCQQLLAGLRAELEAHMIKEEQVLFPMIRQLEASTPASSFHCGSLRNPITVMEHEHDNAGNALARLRDVSQGFTPPEDACNTLRAWLDGLAELEADLHEHIHEENNILFPRAQERESGAVRV